jgi:hypothetical protein
MRIEIVIPDSTQADVKARITSLSDRLSADPQLVMEFAPTSTAIIPDYLAIMEQAQSSPNRFRSGADVDKYLRDLRSEW